MGDEAGISHPIKYVDDDSKPTSVQPVVVGPRTNADESYSALVAIFNTLLLRSNVNLPSFGDNSIGSDTMQELIGKSITVRRLLCRGYISFAFAFAIHLSYHRALLSIPFQPLNGRQLCIREGR